MLPSHKIAQVARNSIKASLGIIVKEDKGFSGKVSDFILQLFHKDSIRGTATWYTPMRAWLNEALVIAIVKQLAPFHTQEKTLCLVAFSFALTDKILQVVFSGCGS
jgi:hypothetical protein